MRPEETLRSSSKGLYDRGARWNETEVIAVCLVFFWFLFLVLWERVHGRETWHNLNYLCGPEDAGQRPVEDRRKPNTSTKHPQPWEKPEEWMLLSMQRFRSGPIPTQLFPPPYSSGDALVECLENVNHRSEGMWERTCSSWLPETLESKPFPDENVCSYHWEPGLRTSTHLLWLSRSGYVFRLSDQSHDWRGSGEELGMRTWFAGLHL